MATTSDSQSVKIAKGAAATIKALMDQQGVSQAELAEGTGKSSSYVSRALNPGGSKYTNSSTGESWSNAPRPETYQAFANFLGVSLTVDVGFEPLPDTETKGKLTPKKGGRKKDVQE